MMLSRKRFSRWLRPKSPARVVVAEDDRDMRSLLVAALRRDGHEVVELSDGNQLLALLQAVCAAPEQHTPPDVIVSDVRMPGYTGMELLDAVRAADIDVPVVLITAFGDPALHERAFDLGATVLDKPFELEDLRRTVRVLVT